MLEKLKSRKFLLTLLMVVIAVCGALGNSDSPGIQIACIVVACVATIAYNIIEGTIDAAAVAALLETTIEAVTDIIEETETAKENGKMDGIETSGTPPDAE